MYQKQSNTQFYLSVEGKCPYLENRYERKIFTSISGAQAEHTQNALSKRGFRRSQNILYRPACMSCAACFSARIPVLEHKASKSERRIQGKNKEVLREVRAAHATDEQYELFQRYVNSRHFNGGMSDMSLFEYQAKVEETEAPSRIIEYRLLEDGRPGRLIGACLTDILDDGLSMVYSFFDPELSKNSLGRYFVLDHIELCAQNHLPYLYLGYWVKNSRNMGYKSNFRPLEIFMSNEWQRLDEITMLDERPTETRRLLLDAHRALSQPKRESDK